MPSWYEVFDNEHVQLATRKQAALLTGLAVGMIILTAALLAAGDIRAVPLPMAGLVVTVAWICAAQVIVVRLRLLRRIVWCVKLSNQSVEGYDYARRKTVLDWLDVRRVELTRTGIAIIGGAASLEIPQLFPEYPRLSHRIVELAESYGVPVFVNGQPWQNLNVYELFPFLSEPADNTSGTWH